MVCLREIVRPTATSGVEQNRPIDRPGRAKARALAGDRQVATGDELTAGGRRHAFDRGDDRLRQGDDLLHEVGAARHRLLVETLAAIGVVAMRLQLLEIVASRQRGAVGGDDDDAGRAIGFDREERVDQRQAQRVARRRRLQRQRRHAALALAAQQGWDIHSRAPSGSKRRSAFGRVSRGEGQTQAASASHQIGAVGGEHDLGAGRRVGQRFVVIQRNLEFATDVGEPGRMNVPGASRDLQPYSGTAA